MQVGSSNDTLSLLKYFEDTVSAVRKVVTQKWHYERALQEKPNPLDCLTTTEGRVGSFYVQLPRDWDSNVCLQWSLHMHMEYQFELCWYFSLSPPLLVLDAWRSSGNPPE